MSFYVVHVVKRAFPGGLDEAGEWIQGKYSDVTLANLRCLELNEGNHLKKHHWYEVRQSAEGLAKSYVYQDDENLS